MPQLFHRRSSVLARLFFFGGPVYLVVAIAMAAQVVHSPYHTRVGIEVEQPIAFSHAHHAGRLQIDCRYCHGSVEYSAFAGMPSSDVCAGCHRQIWTGLGEVQPVLSSVETRIPVSWRRVHDVPDFAFFDHSIHVQKGIGCVTCHGRVDQMTLVHQTETLEMQWCLECHRQPEKFVRPREQVFNMQWTPPEEPQELAELARSLELGSTPTSSAELRRALIAKYNIQRYTSCSNCHQ